MLKTDLSRYARHPDGTVIIEVTSPQLSDLYNNFERHTPYTRRDLDAQLAAYLVECAEEIGRQALMIQIRLEHWPEADPQSRVRDSLSNYFHYLGQLERGRRARARALSLVLLLLGAALQSLVLLLEQAPPFGNELACAALNQGLTVAAWVALWEALATYFVRWWPYRRRQRVYRRLAQAPVQVVPVHALEESSE